MEVLLEKLMASGGLAPQEVKEVVHGVAEGKTDDVLFGAFLMGLICKGPNPRELAVLISSLRELCSTSMDPLPSCLDLSGVGFGDTGVATAVVVAAAGVPVVKGLGRDCSGGVRSLEVLGFRPDLSPRQALWLLERVGLAFVPLPLLHPVVGAVLSVGSRISPLFRVVEALLNPLRARRYLLEVADGAVLGVAAETLAILGCEGAVLTRTGDKAQFCEIRRGRIRELQVALEDLGLKGKPHEDNTPFGPLPSKGGTNSALLLNAAGAFLAAGEAQDLQEGMEVARETISSGRASALLQRLPEEFQLVEQRLGPWTRDYA